ncbi:hypothetical protein X474_27260 [Dethiosulfatarculus sandiegensis]|uniref:Uncharacterized protein n=1 Tax=Dethiosulfatarculus sandiegensis TaxID=1429043 RepID=A0A0D2HK73_9BACT|nr:hypothetical protein X474_27260 [Dethiosulfatarculus sandiegensis]
MEYFPVSSIFLQAGFYPEKVYYPQKFYFIKI